MKTKMCPKLESCTLGKNCSFAHSDRELRPLPEFKKTAICYNYRRGKCFNPDCKFAHGEEDMMGYIPQTTMQARKICPFFIVGRCRNDNCMHAHLHSRRAASRLKTFMVALRNTLSNAKQVGEDPISSHNLKKKLKGGIPWQSLGFAAFREAVAFLPGTEISSDEQYVFFSPTGASKDLLQRLQDVVDSQRVETPSRSAELSSVSSLLDHAPEITTPVGATLELPQQLIRPEQVVGSSCEFFVCPVCEGVALDPVITEKCSHVICRLCLEIWRSLDRSSSFNCPRCQMLVEPDEVTTVATDSASPTAAALAVIYDSIQVNCDCCRFSGPPDRYSVHHCVDGNTTEPASGITPKQGTVIAVGDYDAQNIREETGSHNLLPVKQGDVLELSAESDSGWAFVTKTDTHESGWTPCSFLSPTMRQTTASSSVSGAHK